MGGIAFERALNGCEAVVEPGADGLTITSGAKTDFFRETDGTRAYGNAPVLLTEIDNTRPFTFTARVLPELVTNYDAGAL